MVGVVPCYINDGSLEIILELLGGLLYGYVIPEVGFTIFTSTENLKMYYVCMYTYSPHGLTTDRMHSFSDLDPKNLAPMTPVDIPPSEYLFSELLTSMIRIQLSLECTNRSFISRGMRESELIASPFISGFKMKLFLVAIYYVLVLELMS
jgi:hypothetical protein